MENTNLKGFEFDLPKGNSSIIKVIGVGGGGNNALRHMYEKGIHGVDFVICNTDAQTLDNNPISNKVQLGSALTEGLGAGADPEVGEKAALESIDEIKATLGQNTKMVFITAGMGGGTGTGAAPVIAKVAKEMGILTVGIVTIPFNFEGKRRLEQAETGLEKLRNNVDSLIVINNDKLRQQFGNLGFKSGFAKADEVLANAAKGMAEVITGYFDVNIDFRDAKSVLSNSGTALMSTGTASGENKAEDAVKKALDSPLLNDNKITGAKNVLLLIRSGAEEVTMDEIGVIMDHIQKEAGHTADIIFGVGTDEELGDAVSVLVIATGFSAENQKYAGPTETIRYTLDDAPAKKFPLDIREKQAEERAQTFDNAEKNIFSLDDDRDLPEQDFPMNMVKTEPARKIFDTKKSEEFFHGGKEEPIEEDLDMNLFSFGNEESSETESFSFEVERSLFDEPEAEMKVFEQEKSEEITFSITNETAVEPLDKEEEISEQPVKTYTEEFTIIEKKNPSERIQERKNKLREFNSRYQNFEQENLFETVPAFRRKNISIEGENASEQRINKFLSDDDNGVQLRENRFLNKDVD